MTLKLLPVKVKNVPRIAGFDHGPAVVAPTSIDVACAFETHIKKSVAKLRTNVNLRAVVFMPFLPFLNADINRFVALIILHAWELACAFSIDHISG